MAPKLRKAVIMAGGEGIRLRPLTYVVPKPLLPLGRHTVIEHLVRSLAASGIEEAYVLASYQFDKFAACVEYGKKHGIRVKLEREAGRLGTIGGVAFLRSLLDEPFLLINADLVLEADFQDMYRHHVRQEAVLTLGVKRLETTVPYGVVSLDEHGVFKDFVEKPVQSHIVSVGANIFDPEVFERLDGSYADVPDVVAMLHVDGTSVTTYEFGGEWIDVGHVTDYERAVEMLAGVESLENGER